MAVDDGRGSLPVSVAGAAGAAEVAAIVADRGTTLLRLLLLLRPCVRSSEDGVLTTHAVAVLVVKHRAERHSIADLAMLPCLCEIMFRVRGGPKGARRR